MRKIRKIREKKGWSLRDLASRAEISASMVYYIEIGERQPSLATLTALAAALGVTPGFLLREDE